MKQGQKLAAVQFFSLIHPVTKRFTHVKKGDKFTVTSPEQNNAEFVLISRSKSAKLNTGLMVKLSDLNNLFTKVE